MTLFTAVKSKFPAGVRERGLELFRDVALEVESIERAGVAFEVIGSAPQPYQVAVDWDNEGVVSVHCTCPYFQSERLCKHIWAAFLELDCEDGELPGCNLPDTIFAIELRGHSVQVNNRKAAARKKARPVKKSQPLPTWHDFLNPVFSSPIGQDATPRIMDPAERTEFMFLLDVPHSELQSAVVIRPFFRERGIAGNFGKWKNLSLSRFLHARGDSERDRLLSELAVYSAMQNFSGYFQHSFGGAANDVKFQEPHSIPLLKRLCDTGNVYWSLKADGDEENSQPLRWDNGPAWELRVRVQEEPEQKSWMITGSLNRPDTGGVLPPHEAILVIPHLAVLHDNQLAPCECGQSSKWVSALRKHSKIRVPFADREEFLSKLYSGAKLPLLDLPEQLRLEELSPVPVPKITLRNWAPKSNDRRVLGEVQFDYDGTLVAATEPRHSIRSEDGRRLVKRRSEDESERISQLLSVPQIQKHYSQQNAFGYSYSYGRQPPPKGNHLVEFPESAWTTVLDRLNQFGWNIESAGARLRKAGSVDLSLESNIDWFDLSAAIDFEGVSTTLPTLLQAIRQGDRVVKLSDGTAGFIPDDWVKKFGQLANMGVESEGKVRYSNSQALILDAMLAAQQQTIRADRKFQSLRKKLQKVDGVRPGKEPRSFQGQLRDYQRQGLGWLNFLMEFGFGGCLADDMGLGKTVQVLAMLEARRAAANGSRKTRLPSLAVVPKSLIFNWQDEAAKFAPKLRVAAYHGPDRNEVLNHAAEFDLLITTYATLRLDIKDLKETPFDLVILDEAQAIKNSTAQVTKAARLLNARHRLAMTGTPVENHLGDLWSLFEFLNPGMLGQSKNFKQLTKDIREDTSLIEVLSRGIRPYVLRRTKEQVLTELPTKTEQTLFCELSPKERKLYDELRAHYRAKLQGHIAEKGLAQSQIHVLEALLRLRQAACHPGLVNNQMRTEPSTKLETLEEQLEELVAEGHKVLVFSQFTSLLSILRTCLDRRKFAYEYLDGKTSNRKACVDRFQTDPRCQLFLISLKAGGHGLNLTAADYVFILDPWWNPAAEAQAVDRAHRMGQTKPVFAYRLIAKDTVEEKILQLQQHKQQLADSIISADAGLLQSLTAEDLNLLLS